jgi:transposase
MNKDVTQLRFENKELTELVQSLRSTIGELEANVALLTHEKQCLLKRLFGRSSEKIDPRQLELLLGLAEAEEPAAESAPKETTRRPRRGGRRGKPRIPEDLPTEEIVLVPPEVEKDPEAFVAIGEEVTQELDYIAPKYFRRLYIRRKFVRKAERSLPPVIAPLPPRLIRGGYAGVALLVDIALKKFIDHLPLYRQEQILKSRYGIEISRKTMCDWLEQVAWWLKPIYNHIAGQLRQLGYLQIDETPIRYCQAEGGGSRQGYLWVYHAPGSGVYYEWHTGRGAECLEGMLAEFGGTAQTDGYGAYGSYVNGRARRIEAGESAKVIELAACWAHVRRKFKEALEESPVQAAWVLNQIGMLYGCERELRENRSGPALRAARRSSHSSMVAGRIGKMLRLKLASHRPASQMAKAIRYTLSLWPQLQCFLEKGEVEIDNNRVENAIRPTALGKKNYLFFGAPEAGERAAIFYTILENCKLEGINPQEYLRDVLSRLPSMSHHQTGYLTPAAWAAQRKRQAA